MKHRDAQQCDHDARREHDDGDRHREANDHHDEPGDQRTCVPEQAAGDIGEMLNRTCTLRHGGDISKARARSNARKDQQTRRVRANRLARAGSPVTRLDRYASRTRICGGIVLASGSAVGKKESAMTSKDNESDVPVSNWTLATGTKPFERHVYPPMIQSTPRQSATKERP
jgi:hypothetical protein